jgi:hypothetical protein
MRPATPFPERTVAIIYFLFRITYSQNGRLGVGCALIILMSITNHFPSREPNDGALLFHADASDPDLLYFSGFNAVDPYLAFTLGRKKSA